MSGIVEDAWDDFRTVALLYVPEEQQELCRLMFYCGVKAIVEKMEFMSPEDLETVVEELEQFAAEVLVPKAAQAGMTRQ